MSASVKKIGWLSASAIVVANMVGSGVFASLGLQLEIAQNTWTIISLWFIGWIMALFGAFSYAELGTQLPKSGGEYYYLTKIYHPFVGYLAGWVSLTVGFSASIALSAMAMGEYTTLLIGIPPYIIAIVTVLLISFIHSFSIQQSSSFQNIFTTVKVCLMIFLVVACFYLPSAGNAFNWSDSWKGEVFSSGYAASLILVVYAYSGWNAAAYIVEEIEVPEVNLPKALVGGTVLISILYFLIQLAFLNQAPLEALQGKVEVGQIVAEYAFGFKGGITISFIIALFLISSLSAMVWVGPRVTRAMAEDYHIWRFLSKDNIHGIPVRAIWLQAAISIFMVLTGSFKQVLLYSGFVLQLISTLAVLGVIIRRIQARNGGYKSPGYPIFQIIYIVISLWILGYMIIDQPYESLIGLLNLVLGAISYWRSKKIEEYLNP